MIMNKQIGGFDALVSTIALYFIYLIVNITISTILVKIIKNPKWFINYKESLTESDKDVRVILLFFYIIISPFVYIIFTPTPNPTQTEVTILNPGQYTRSQYGDLMMHPDPTKEPVTIYISYKNRFTDDEIPTEHISLKVYKDTYTLRNDKQVVVYRSQEFDTRSQSGKNEIEWKKSDN